MAATRRLFPVGAELCAESHVAVRVWAPAHSIVQLQIDGRVHPLDAAASGYYHGTVPGHAGSRYGFLLGDDPQPYPDPASRSQPDGPHGLSEVIDPTRFAWRDPLWRGLTLDGQVLYEMHVGTFTREGTWRAAASRLSRLRELGITVVQMMPIAEFDGAFGWGYDGVCWFAPSHLYGRPDDLRAFVDEAHVLGLGVILDVVYNHLGPSGNYLPKYSSNYTSTQYENDWGQPLNFDGPAAGPVRELVLSNVEYWIAEFHIDGFRLDATQQIFDRSPEPLIAAIAERARAVTDRGVIITGENEPQDPDLVRPKPAGGYGLDAVYNDDFHHAARVALTGIREAYYTDYTGSSRELLAAARWGFLFQGQYYSWQQKTRGASALDARPTHFVSFLENHDQVANSAHGRRLSELAHPGDLRALTALLLLAPSTPMLFQGQEYGSTAPWAYFAGHTGELGEQVRHGRVGFLQQFPRLSDPDVVQRLADPLSRRTFESTRLSEAIDERGARLWQLHKDLIALRHGEPTFSTQTRPEGACLNEHALLLRAGDGMATRLILVNLGTDLPFASLSEPLAAPPLGARWRVCWSSEHPDYGGGGTPLWTDERWTLPGHAAVVLAAEPRTQS